MTVSCQKMHDRTNGLIRMHSMMWYYTSIMAWRGIGMKPSRTFLTLLGISIGIGAVMLIASMGAGTRDLITSEISGIGADIISIQPGRESSGFADIAARLYSDTLKERDVDALSRKEYVPHAIAVEPTVLVSGSVSYGNEVYYPQVFGGSAQFYEDVFDIHVAEGVLHDDTEAREKAAVAVIGDTVREELFGNMPALGERITIHGKKFRVIGLLPPTGQVAFAQIDELVIIPYTTAQTYLTGQDHFNEIIVRVDDPANVAYTVRDIERTLRDVRDFDPEDENDFVIRTPDALMEQVDTILFSLTLFLTAVVAIALIVGGIGIMNSMLVAVTERTREIGLRKAVGARDRDILLQFLVEAVLITGIGGVFGVVLGGVLSYITSLLIRAYTTLDWVFVVPLNATLYALLFSVCIGVLFGSYPAYIASRKIPMEALRYE
jgi:putative ABC transport system permease protein